MDGIGTRRAGRSPGRSPIGADYASKLYKNISVNVKEGPDGEGASHTSYSRRGPPTTSAVTPAFAVAVTGSGKRVRPAGLIDDVAHIAGQVAVAQPRLVRGDGWAGGFFQTFPPRRPLSSYSPGRRGFSPGF